MLLLFYVLIIVLGVLSMGFQLLGSRLLSPPFGSSLDVWAWLISTFLAAFSSGSIIGGAITNLVPSRRARAQIVVAAVAIGSLAFTTFFAWPLLDRIEITFVDTTLGLLVSCAGLFFIPVTALSSFSPQCVQYVAARGTAPGAASGIVYGASTVGNIAGVMLTAFVFIPRFGVAALMRGWLSVAVVSLAVLVWILRSRARSR
jgi:hypothetical protein